ncbi:TldD/PmbA family protein [Thermococcus sp. M36]|uniref:metallopeptidase TldD-related protein n=1 Tax=Thermococcus sp. M36 TaxID=1638261 RepID=UPI001439E94D|nr:metallopeptidase TldD-related protein [Thermococcus sp. M36]NJE04883.1 TldD/PmbA family protein [Thermococcus sp. M36]
MRMEVEVYRMREVREKLSYSSGTLRPESGERAFTVVRVVKDGRIGQALVEGIDEKAEERARELATKLSKLSPKEDYRLPEGEKARWGRAFKGSLFEHTDEIKETIALAENEGIGVPELEVGLLKRQVDVWNSRGAEVRGEYSIVDVSFSLVRGDAFFREQVAFPEIPGIRRLISEGTGAIKKAERMEKASPGETRVILSPLSFAELLYLGLVREASGSLLVRGASVLREGQRVAGENFTLYDDPLDETSLKPAKADDEGVSTKRRALISEGTFTGHLWDSYWAYKVGRKSTGNAVRVEANVFPAPHHLTLSGDASLDEMLAELEDGYLIAGLMGLGGVDSKTGNFSVLANPAFVVRNREIAALTSFTITGNIKRLLEGIELVGMERRGIWFEPVSMAFPHVLTKVKVVP